MIRRFDASALYEAVDAERRSRGMTWREVGDAIGVSVSTIKRTRLGGRMEVDGMLNIVGWLNVPVEDFVVESDL